MSIPSEEILDFWQSEIGRKGWISPDPKTIEKMRTRFADVIGDARNGDLGSWICGHESCLALVLLLDQFPRILHRGKPESFACDGQALAVAKRAIVMGHDLKVPEHLRLFFYLPLMHSESLMDQERCVRLMSLRMPKCTASQLKHARAHRDIIRQFGRFPCRNVHLGRHSTPAEQRYLEKGGYDHVVAEVAA